jgi:hypothetical protein
MRSMKRAGFFALDPFQDQRRGPFDPDPQAEPDLWFLPSDPDPEDTGLGPGRRDSPLRLFDPGLWALAQDRHSGPLAELAALVGALDERLRSGPEGWRQRLALLEAADLGWWTGERIAMDRLALWVGLRQGATGEDSQEVIRAGWAVRRLSGGPGPAEGGWEAGLKTILGRTGQGETAPETIADMADIMEQAGALHPLTQAAMLFHGWRMLGQEKAGQGGATDVEAAVLAARHGAKVGRGAALFLPLALTGPRALRATGTELERLGAWIAGATQATLAALLHLDRLCDWVRRAEAATADLTGRTPLALIAALAAWPMLSAPMAEEITGASRAAVQRNLDTLAVRGLNREVTGQGRFRVWAARV